MAKTKAKSTSKAKTAKKKTKDSISAKQYGRNIVLIVDGEKYSRAFKEKEERDDMMLSVESYNAKPTKKLKTFILNKMNELEREKKAKAKEVETAKKTLKKAPKTSKPKKVASTEQEIAKAKELLEKHNYNVSKPSPRTRGGEY